jgi:hypothetical protein
LHAYNNLKLHRKLKQTRLDFITVVSKGIAGMAHSCIRDHQTSVRIMSPSYLVFNFLLSVLNLRKSIWMEKAFFCFLPPPDGLSAEAPDAPQP